MFRHWRRRIVWSILFFASLVLCLVLHGGLSRQVDRVAMAVETPASTSSQEQLVQQGVDYYQAGNFAQAITLWEQALPQIKAPLDKATVYSNLAIAYRKTGQLDRAIRQWEQAIQIYRSQDQDATRQLLAKLLTEQGQAYSDLGQQRRAITLLDEAVQIASKNQDRLTQAAAQGAIGNAKWSLGDYDAALAAHQGSLKIARELNNTQYIATALNNLGNVYVSRADRYSYQANSAELEGDDKEAARLAQSARQDRVEARNLFEQSVQAAAGVVRLEEVRALMNLTHLIQQSSAPDGDLMLRNWNRVQELLAAEPMSPEKAYALINLAQQQLNVGKSANFNLQPATFLEQALNVARTIGDARTQSFALGSLGQLYETAGDYSKAMELTRRAQFAAQQVNAPDSLYRWQWQAGRILKATGDTEKAIAAYEQAIASLQTIRGDIVAANRELQLDFREQVEPIYRELMALLLESPLASRVSNHLSVVSGNLEKQLSIDQKQQSNRETSPVQKVVDTLELLKLAELQNFFGDECVQVALSQGGGYAGLSDANTVAIYSVILNDRTAMILRSPDGSMTYYPVAMSKQQIEAEINRLRYFLELRATDEYLPQAQKIYNLLLRPMEADLSALKPNTLVFINDGVLRKVPMAALHDGKEFLVQKYPISTVPSLSLTARKPLDRTNLSTLSLGLTVERPPFAPLTNVQAEVTAVNQILGGTELLDRAFTLSNLQTQLQKNSYRIVHIATHGKFGVDAQSTYLVGFDQRISIEQLDNLLRSTDSSQPVELLTLSACQTAAGDDRSALGIAGVAVRAGVESALATLWYINDEATVPLIEEFYRQLRQSNISKVQALRQAQLKMIADVNYNHPAVWSPFILIGNWL
jgi:CHAT domain-containing protein